MRHWTLTLWPGRREMTVRFGAGGARKPTLAAGNQPPCFQLGRCQCLGLGSLDTPSQNEHPTSPHSGMSEQYPRFALFTLDPP